MNFWIAITFVIRLINEKFLMKKKKKPLEKYYLLIGIFILLARLVKFTTTLADSTEMLLWTT